MSTGVPRSTEMHPWGSTPLKRLKNAALGISLIESIFYVLLVEKEQMSHKPP